MVFALEPLFFLCLSTTHHTLHHTLRHTLHHTLRHILHHILTVWLVWVVRFGVVWCGMVWYGVVCCGMVWYGVVWCGMVWYGVVWCGWVVWCGMENRGLPESGPDESSGTSVWGEMHRIAVRA